MFKCLDKQNMAVCVADFQRGGLASQHPQIGKPVLHDIGKTDIMGYGMV
jgi:hypothetical protein